MASLTSSGRAILRQSNSIQRFYLSQSRCFSAYQPLNAEIASANVRNMPQQQSTASRLKTLKRSQIPTDLGLIPQTYIRPCGDLPKLFKEPRVRLRLEWLYTKQTILSFISLIQQLRWSVVKDPLTGKRNKLPLQLRERYTVTKELHTRLYEAIAQGDKGTITKIACSGLENQQNGRLDRRRIDQKPNESWSVKYRGWVVPQRLLFTFQSLVPSYFKAMHVVADRSAPIPIGPGMTLRQVIVRVDSTQTRDRNDGSPAVTKNLREYVVLQKMIIDGVSQDWRIWGTVTPTSTAEAIEFIESTKAQTGGATGNLMERMQNLSNI